MIAQFLEDIYFYQMIALLAGLGVFMVGMKLMSDSMEKISNNKLRNLFNRVSSNKAMGVGVGAATTAIIQSSSATTVLVVGFVNAGVLALTQAVPIIMGANIGTTITALLASLQTFKITQMATGLAVVGAFMMMLSKNETKKTIGSVLAGLGLLFVGLGNMSASMSMMKDSAFFTEVITSVSDPIVLLLAGAVLTAIVQSSSAVTGILIAMVTGGIAIGGGGNAVLFIILGTNIGTCITALLSMIGTSTNAKRAATIHLLFNVIGAMIFFVLLLIFPSFNAVTFEKWFPGAPATQIAFFHLFFNVMATLLLLPFSNFLVFLSTKIVKEKVSVEVAGQKMKFLDERILKTPSIAVAQLIKEVGGIIRLSRDALKLALDSFLAGDDTQMEEIKNKKKEIRFFVEGVTKFLIVISGDQVSYKDESTIASLYHVVNDIERIADYALNISRYTETVKADQLVFSNEVTEGIAKMFEALQSQFANTVSAFESRKVSMLPEIERKEDEVDAFKKQLVAGHIRRLNDGECNPKSSSVFINLIGNLERVGDHLVSISRTIKTK